MATLRISNSIRLILSIFRLYAGIEEGFGESILQILEDQYPDQFIDMDPARLGHKLMGIARRQTQGNDSDAMDAIQDLLTYLSTGPRFKRDDKGKTIVDPTTGKMEETEESKPWDFTKDSDTWQEALVKIYSNLKSTAMSKSMGKMRKTKQERSIDEAFGRKTDDGGHEDAMNRIPDNTETMLSKALDDKTAIKEFIELIDEHLPDLRTSLSSDALKLFTLIFDDGVGDFSSNIKENMGQASALKEQYPDLYEKNIKRWSGFVGDLRRKLIDEIWNYIETEMSYKDYVRLRDQFFGDTAPTAVRLLEKKKIKEKAKYQRMLDENKISRLKAKMIENSGKLTVKDQKVYDRLSKRLEDSGINVDEIEADESAGAKSRGTKKYEENLDQLIASTAHNKLAYYF